MEVFYDIRTTFSMIVYIFVYLLIDWYPSFEILVLGNFDANNNRAITYSLHVYIN